MGGTFSFPVNNCIIFLTLLQKKRERECQRLRKGAEDKQALYLDWARRFEAKSGVNWHPGDDGGQTFTIISLASLHDDCLACR